MNFDEDLRLPHWILSNTSFETVWISLNITLIKFIIKLN